jgi:hypothetical protein
MTYNLSDSSLQNSDSTFPPASLVRCTLTKDLCHPKIILHHKKTRHPRVSLVGAFHSIDAALQFAPIWLAEAIRATNSDHNDPVNSCCFFVGEVGKGEDIIVTSIPARRFLPVSKGIVEVLNVIASYQTAKAKRIALTGSLTAPESTGLNNRVQGLTGTTSGCERSTLRALNVAFHYVLKLGVASWNKPNAGAAERASFVAAYKLPETFADRYMARTNEVM